ncbi:MAG: hypothetical protein R3F20_04855 [Planctomycetota bacterium]
MSHASRIAPIRLASALRTAFVVLVLAAGARAGGQDGPAPDVAALIAKLGHSEFEIREEATTALIALGERSRPALETALESADLETRLRIEAILRLLPVETESSTTSLEPQRVTLQVTERPLGEVVTRLERDTSVRFHRPLQVPEDRPVTLALSDMPLLEALDVVSEAIGSRWVRDYGTDLIRFVQNPGARPICRYFGPVRVAFTGVSRNASLQFGIGRTEQCLLQGQIDLEPGCRVLGIWSPPALTEVRDDRETDLRPETPPIEQFTTARDRMSFHFSFGLRAPAKEAESIRRLAGRLRLAIATSYQVVEFDCRQERVRSEGKTTVRLASNSRCAAPSG